MFHQPTQFTGWVKSETFGSFVSSALKSRGVTIRQLSEHTGISNVSLRFYISDLRPTPKAKMKIIISALRHFKCTIRVCANPPSHHVNPFE